MSQPKSRPGGMLTSAAAAATLLAGLTLGAGAHADHRHGAVRVHLPVHHSGPETLHLRKMLRHRSGVDIDRYRLRAVVVKGTRFSNGYARLRVGDVRTGRYHIASRERQRIAAPARDHGKWRLRLGPGSQVRSVTVVLEPRLQSRKLHRHDRWNDGYAWYEAPRVRYHDAARDRARDRYRDRDHRQDQRSRRSERRVDEDVRSDADRRRRNADLPSGGGTGNGRYNRV